MATSKVWVFNGTQLEEYAPAAGTVAMADIDGLADALAGKAPLTHKHPLSDVIGLEGLLGDTGGKRDVNVYEAGEMVAVRKDPTTGFWPASWSGKTPVYTGGSASAGVRPTSSASVICVWIGPDPSPAVVSSGTAGMRDDARDLRFKHA